LQFDENETIPASNSGTSVMLSKPNLS